MKLSDFGPASPGRLVDTVGGAKAFLPSGLPTELILPPALTKLIGEAHAALGRLDEAGRFLPNPDLFIRPLQKQEAVLSSRIEGTLTTLEDAFANEASGLQPIDDDAREVRNYERALRDGVTALERGQTLSISLLRGLHRVLLSDVRGRDKMPGDFRKEQVWLGGADSRNDISKARFVPTPGAHVPAAMDALEDQILKPGADDPLVRVALTHYQFETIHPFMDGNGRVGRLLIVLQLMHEKVLERPWLYVSPFLEAERETYYRLLYEVSSRGAFVEWIEFFLLAVRQSARSTSAKIQALRELDRDFRSRLAHSTSQKPALLLESLYSVPIITVPLAQAVLESTAHTARAAIQKLVSVAILEELAWRPKGLQGRPPVVFRCKEVIDLIQG